MIATLVQLAVLFGGLSLLAFGGGTAVLPDMQRARSMCTTGSPVRNSWRFSRFPVPRRGRDR